MRIDATKSNYHEDTGARADYSKQEIRRMRLLLRRLRFLETKIRDQGGLSDGGGSGGSAFAEWEADALEWALDELGFLQARSEHERSGEAE